MATEDDPTGNGYFETGLPDVTEMTLDELLTTTDPVLLAAAQRVGAEAMEASLRVSVEMTRWPGRHPLE